MSRILITGSNGQDGRYLAEILKQQGHEVDGQDLPHDVADGVKGGYDEVYHLAGPCNPRESIKSPDLYMKPYMGLCHIFRENPNARVFVALSSLMFTGYENMIETSIPNPQTPYAIGKVAMWQLAKLHNASCGILFNHTSPLQKGDFLMPKIARGGKIRLGNPDVRRDFLHAKDAAKAMTLAIKEPGDYIIASGEHHSVREIVEIAGVEAEFNCPEFVRKEPRIISGNPRKIKALGWEPEYDIEGIVKDLAVSIPAAA